MVHRPEAELCAQCGQKGRRPGQGKAPGPRRPGVAWYGPSWLLYRSPRCARLAPGREPLTEEVTADEFFLAKLDQGGCRDRQHRKKALVDSREMRACRRRSRRLSL